MYDYLVRFGGYRWRLVRADNADDAKQMVAAFFKGVVSDAIEVKTPDQAVAVLVKKADFEQLVLCATRPSADYKQVAMKWLSDRGKPTLGRGPATLAVDPMAYISMFG